MTKLAWLTDIHLDFLNLAGIQAFAEKALESAPDVFLLGGDISVAPLLHAHLRILEHYWQRPIYFVLGNHDYYKGSINKIHAELLDFTREYPHLKWLPQEGIVELSLTTAVTVSGPMAVLEPRKSPIFCSMIMSSSKSCRIRSTESCSIF